MRCNRKERVLLIMPRRARIDAPGALHHVICRGIERCRIFWEDSDRDDFLKRLSVYAIWPSAG